MKQSIYRFRQAEKLCAFAVAAIRNEQEEATWKTEQILSKSDAAKDHGLFGSTENYDFRSF